MKQVLFVLFGALLCTPSFCQPPAAATAANDKGVVIAYVTSWTERMPDPTYVTHVNYAFGHVSDSFDGVRISNPDRLARITALKSKAPALQVLLSIGGWGSGRFSEMAASETFRKAFATDCQRVVEEFNLDGIDIDWEYPTSKAGGISASPDDTDNFTLLMQDIRQAIGNDKLLTLASVASGRYIDFKAIEPTVDFVNIMSYDMGNPPYHHAPLYASEHVRGGSIDDGVKAHIAAGMPAEKLVLGIPFYGRAGGETGLPNFIHYREIVDLKDVEPKWDADAMVPYLVNADGQFVCTYETAESIAIKCHYIHERGLRGAMYWEYAGDTDEGTLQKAVYSGVIASEKAR